MADGPLAPPSIYHRTNGTWDAICVPGSYGGSEKTERNNLPVHIHDDATCSTQGWLMSYPGSPRDDSLIESVREFMREFRQQRGG